jgi:peptide/nickel transport system substrate-binding protein
MDFQLLGPVEATFDGRPVALGPTKQRALLAMLALHANATVGVDRLIDGLWGEDPPATAPKMVQLYVSQLRRLLSGDDAEIVTHGRGYELRVRDDAIDAARFERLVEQAAGDDVPNGHAQEALALWRGAALADVADEPFARVEIRRLDELRLRASELAVDAELAAGRDQEALTRLERLIEEHPLRERLYIQRMLALYRSGRQADALAAYVAARRRLVDEIGVEPDAELRDLHERILQQDPELRLRPARVRPPSSPAAEVSAGRGPPVARAVRQRHVLLAAALALLAGGAVFAFTRLTGPHRLPGIAGGAVGVIDAHTSAITNEYRLHFQPGAVAAGGGSVWVADPKDGTVSRIPRKGNEVRIIDVGRNPAGLAFGGGSLWVAGGDDGALARVDPAENRILSRVPIGNGLRGLAVGYGAVWAATALDGEVVRVDLASGGVVKRIPVGGHPVAVAVGDGSVWVVGEDSKLLVRIDPRSNQPLDGIAVGGGPDAVVDGLGAVWVANRADGTVSRIDPATDRVTDTAPAGRLPVALAIDDGALWVADADGAVLRIDPRRRAAPRRVHTGSSPAGLAAVGGDVWATALDPAAAHRGGTLRLGWGPVANLDSGWAGYDGFSGGLIDLAYDGLLGYRRETGVAGMRLVGNLAERVPEPADGGRSYTFRLRPGLRFSDGTPVHASDFRASMQRMLAVAKRLWLPGLYDAIAGAPSCRRSPKRCDLSRGIVIDDRTGTITLHLRRPDPDLLSYLAGGLSAVLPAATPPAPSLRRPIPGTGPYRVERIARGRRILSRNPYFRPRDGRPAGFANRIEVAVGHDNEGQVRAVERGQLDFAFAPRWPAPKLDALRTRVGARLHSAANVFTLYAWLNMHSRPFDDPRVRQALNLALDRRRIVDAFGGPEAAAPTCQILPPGMPGYRPICSFTVAPTAAGGWTAPDLARARRLIAASGSQRIRVDVWAPSFFSRQAAPVAQALRKLGFPSRVRVFEDLTYDRRLPPHLGLNGWFADGPGTAAFLRTLVSCRPHTSSDNYPHLCGYGADEAIDRAQAAGPSAGDAWRQVETLIAAHAPVAPLVNRRTTVLTSTRAGNLQFSPIVGLYFEQLWVR